MQGAEAVEDSKVNREKKKTVKLSEHKGEAEQALEQKWSSKSRKGNAYSPLRG